MGRFICEVQKDHVNNELKLVNTDNYYTIEDPNSKGAIKFKDRYEFDRYFYKHCKSEKELLNEGNNLFMFLFFILLVIFLVTLLCQYLNGKTTTVNMPDTSSFGRFSF